MDPAASNQLPLEAAIYYAADAFDTSKHLMGRRSAGEAFIRAYIQHGSLRRLSIYAHPVGQRHFATHFRRLVSPEVEISNISLAQLGRLAEVGTLFLPDPAVAKVAWRRRSIGNRSYSICGVTHTLASRPVMEMIESLCIAPVQSWDALICTSNAARKTVHRALEETKSYFAQRLGVEPKVDLELPVIPLGVHCEEFARSEAQRAALRGRYGLVEGDVLLLFLGRLSSHAKANPIPMYQAIQTAARTAQCPVHLLLAGWFPNAETEKEFSVQAKHYAPDVTIHVLDKPDSEARRAAYSAADIFVSLSDNIQETFGLTPLEAMAAGLPVVASDWNGYRDTVRHGEDGFLVATYAAPPDSGGDLAMRYALEVDNYDLFVGQVAQFAVVDHSSCAEALTLLIRNRDLRDKMGNAARQHAYDRFDWSKVLKQYQELWRELSDRRDTAEEIAPRTSGGPPRPSWADPFRIFGDYPSVPWNDHVRVQPGSNREGAGSLTEKPFSQIARGRLCSIEEIDKVLSLVSASTVPVRASDIWEQFPERRRALVRRTLFWMAKFDLLKFTAPPE